jgi:hypothetical protein
LSASSSSSFSSRAEDSSFEHEVAFEVDSDEKEIFEDF